MLIHHVMLPFLHALVQQETRLNVSLSIYNLGYNEILTLKKILESVVFFLFVILAH